MLAFLDSINDSFKELLKNCLALRLRFSNKSTSNGSKLLTCNVKYRTPKSLHEIAIHFFNLIYEICALKVIEESAGSLGKALICK